MGKKIFFYLFITGVRLNKKTQDNYFKIKPFQGF
jgi:hypothetical protein